MKPLDVTGSNWSSGAGVIDSYNSLIVDIKNAHDGDRATVAVEIGLAAVSLAVDNVAFVLNPLSKLAAAGLGWMIEHLTFLTTPLDLLAGNPKEIQSISDQLHGFAQDLHNTARDLEARYSSDIADWVGAGADSLHPFLLDCHHAIDVVGNCVDVVGYVVETNMAVISALRNLVRDMITSVLGDIIATMAVALATAPLTSGASLVVGLSECLVLGAAKVAEIMGKLVKVLGLSARAAARVDELVDSLRGVARSLGVKFDDLRGIRRPGSTEDELEGIRPSSVDDVVETPGPRPSPGSDEIAGGNHQNAKVEMSDTSTLGDDDSVFKDWLVAERHFNGEDVGDASAEKVDSAAARQPSAADDGSSIAVERTTYEPPSALEHERDVPTVATAPVRNSPLKKYDVPTLKRHENWLKEVGLQNEHKTTKFIEEGLKGNHPDAYPYIKAISDAKSSKNYVGLAIKAELQEGKQLADIQERADQDHRHADEKWHDS